MIDKYVIYDLIATGSYAKVYRGMDDHTKKQVAVKLINLKEYRSDPNPVVRDIKLKYAKS